MSIRDFLPNSNSGLKTVELAEVVLPDEVILSIGDGSYKKLDSTPELFAKAGAYFSAFTRQNNAMITEISKEQYQAAMKNYNSVQFKFRYDIPFADYCGYHNIKRSAGFNSLEYFSALSFSSAAKDSVFVADEHNEKYYRFIADIEMNPLSVIDDAPDSYGIYYPSSEILGTDGDALISISDTVSLLNAKYVPEYLPTMDEKRTEIAENIFGENFSFVRRITDGFGNITYIYKYGQKSLSFSVDGTLEYRSELESGESQGFFPDLSEALLGIEKCGGYNSAMPYVGLKLAYASTQYNGRNVVRSFLFTQMFEGRSIYGESFVAIEATVTNGQLTQLKRNTIDVTRIEKGDEVNVTAVNAVAKASPDLFDGRLEDIRLGYHGKDGSLTAVYMIRLRDGSRVFVKLDGDVVE